MKKVIVSGMLLCFVLVAAPVRAATDPGSFLSPIVSILANIVNALSSIPQNVTGTQTASLATVFNSLQSVLDQLSAVLKNIPASQNQSNVNGAPVASSNAAPTGIAPGEILVRFKNGVSDEDQDAQLKAWGLNKKSEIPDVRVKVVSVPAGAEAEVAQALSQNPKIDFAEVNGLVTAQAVPNDPYYPSQWHLSSISAPGGWNVSTGTPSVVIAVVDSGANAVADLAPNLTSGWNFLTGTSNTADSGADYGHGTAVAGTAAAATNNSTGVSGTNWNSKIMPLEVVNSSSYASWSNVASAVTYAADHGAKVVNVSLEGTSDSATMQSAMNYAWSKGLVIVASAGNYGNSSPVYPAWEQNVMAVSAINNASGTFASFSSYGSDIAVSAPGNYILTTDQDGGYGQWYGTSFSSPQVAGLAALIFSENPALSNSQVVSLIEQNADDLGTVGWDQYYGWGRIDVQKALQAAVNAAPLAIDTTAPSTSITSPANGQTVSGTVSVSASASDNVGVTRVELWKDGVLFATDTTTPYTFSWNTALDMNKSHTLQTKAYDAAGNVGISAVVTVTVSNSIIADTTAPTVAITNPANNSVLPSRGNASVNATASDNVGVTEIDILLDGVLRASCLNATSCSYSINVKKISSGSHTITANAYDAAKNKGTASITVTK